MTPMYVTTPVGRRTVPLAVLKHQFKSRPDVSSSVDKWKIYRALCEAKPKFGLTDRALAILNALVSFYPKGELSAGETLVVFPSNAQLALRAHGMSEQTIRRHVALLVNLGFIKRKDSPNGKRYAHKDRQGVVSDAFGFDLTPLLVRATEIENTAAEVQAARLAFQRCREQISICRRDIAKLIETARVNGIPGDWDRLFNAFRDVVDSVPRSPTQADLDLALTSLLAIHQSVSKQLERLREFENESANGPQIERHIQDSKPESYIEPAERSGSATPEAGTQYSSPHRHAGVRAHPSQPTIPLDLVLKTCPDIRNFAPNGIVRGWDDLIHASLVVRQMLGITPSAIASAHFIMGKQATAIVIACLLQKITSITSPGGYLRQLVRKCEAGSFSPVAMIQALARESVRSKS